MPRPQHFGLILFVSVQSLLPVATALAGDSEDVELLIKQGVDLRQQGRDARALLLFQQAFTLARTPRTASQLGLCEMAVGYWIDAERHLSEGLSFAEHPWVSKNRRDLEVALENVRGNIGELSIEGGPSGAVVSVNGREVGTMPLPAPLRVNKGIVEIELRAPGHSASSRSLTIKGGEKQRITIALARLPEASPPPAVQLEKSVPSNPSDSGPSGGSFQRPLAWALAGVAGLAVAFAAIETSSWLEKRQEFEQHTGPLPSDLSMTGKNCGIDEKGYGGPGCLAIHDGFARARMFSVIGYAAGGALAVTSIVLFATSGPQEPKRHAALTCSPNLLAGGLTCATTLRW